MYIINVIDILCISFICLRNGQIWYGSTFLYKTGISDIKILEYTEITVLIRCIINIHWAFWLTYIAFKLFWFGNLKQFNRVWIIICSQNLNYFLKLLNTWLPSKYVTCILSLNVYLHNDYCQHLVLCTGLFYILMNYFSK